MSIKNIVVFVLVLLLAACSGGTPEPTATATETPARETATKTATVTATATITSTPEPSATATPAVIDVGPTNFPEGVNPLTGLAVADAELLNRRPIATKIQLYPRYGRPPIGINAADAVWEYYHNGGITRLHVVFYGQDAEQFGPIRSARLPDNDLIQMYDSIFAYGSADQRINNRLFNASYAPYLVLEGAASLCPPTPENPMCRFEPAGQNLLLSGTAELSEYIVAEEGLTNERQDLDGLRFTSEMPGGGEANAALNLRYSADSYVRWEYDPDLGVYVRYQDARFDDGTGEEFELLTERESEEAVTAANVVVVVAEHSYFVRSGGSEIVEIDLLGSGSAYVFRDGQVFEVFWSRPTADVLLTTVDAQGNPFPLKPGNTWYQVVGTSSNITQPEADSYRFESRIP